jgi:hypothetical protein
MIEPAGSRDMAFKVSAIIDGPTVPPLLATCGLFAQSKSVHSWNQQLGTGTRESLGSWLPKD